MKRDLTMNQQGVNELSVDELYLDYGSGASANPILKGVSMHLRKGEVVALLGPSGSGKTTLLRAVAGLESPRAGTIDIGERRVFDGGKRFEMPAEERNLGLVFQSYALWPHKTVFDNVAYGLKLRKLSAADIKPRVMEVLAQLVLGHLGERFPHQLSGGQQQRVAIARALVYNPPVILLDEPLSNLNAKLREEARAFLRELIVRLGLSALMVTHDQGEAMAISDRILLLNNGKIEQQGTPQSMYQTPDTLFTANSWAATIVCPVRCCSAMVSASPCRSKAAPCRPRRAAAIPATTSPESSVSNKSVSPTTRPTTPFVFRYRPACIWVIAGSACSKPKARTAQRSACAPTRRTSWSRASTG